MYLFYCAGDVFAVVAPTNNIENVKYYLMCCTKRKMKLLENYDDNRFIYDRGSIILKVYFFQKNHQIQDCIYFEDYEPDVISCQYSHLVCATHIKLIEFQLKKKTKIKKWKMSKYDHERSLSMEFHWNFFD